jgi:excinuclease UvrABC helicase subunit UvrB
MIVDNNKNLKNLANFLKFFINRPNHLAKYLLDHDALDNKFLSSLQNNKYLTDDSKSTIDLYFVDINQMNNFFKSLLENKGANKLNDIEDLKGELNKELDNCLKEERYEDAIRIRDYLRKISKDPH